MIIWKRIFGWNLWKSDSWDRKITSHGTDMGLSGEDERSMITKDKKTKNLVLTTLPQKEPHCVGIILHILLHIFNKSY